MKDPKNSAQREIDHFTHLEHVWWGLKTPAGQKRYDNKVKEFIKLCQTKNVLILEVGCGDGAFTKRLAKELKGDSRIIATDITPKLINNAKKTIKNKRISFKIGDAEDIKYKKSTFDIACGISILHHVNTLKTLREIYKVLKKGGEIFFTEPNYLNPHIFLGLNINFLRTKMEYSPDETAFKRWGLEKTLKYAGFKNIIVRNYDFLHPSTPSGIIAFMEKLGSILERVYLLKEISGSLLIYAKK